jgi:hypothetical protein
MGEGSINVKQLPLLQNHLIVREMKMGMSKGAATLSVSGGTDCQLVLSWLNYDFLPSMSISYINREVALEITVKIPRWPRPSSQQLEITKSRAKKMRAKSTLNITD